MDVEWKSRGAGGVGWGGAPTVLRWLFSGTSLPLVVTERLTAHHFQVVRLLRGSFRRDSLFKNNLSLKSEGFHWIHATTSTPRSRPAEDHDTSGALVKKKNPETLIAFLNYTRSRLREMRSEFVGNLCVVCRMIYAVTSRTTEFTCTRRL